MNREQWKSLIVEQQDLAIRADYFDSAPRTLLYGYDCERSTWHIYMDAGRICRAVYEYKATPLVTKREVWDDPRELIPPKRVYPESCDYDFTLWLRQHGYDVPMLPFDGERAEKVAGLQFHGEVEHERGSSGAAK